MLFIVQENLYKGIVLDFSQHNVINMIYFIQKQNIYLSKCKNVTEQTYISILIDIKKLSNRRK